MSLQVEKPNHCNADPPRLNAPRNHWFFWIMVIVTGWLLFAHGCHGDEDTELFTAATRIVSGD